MAAGLALLASLKVGLCIDVGFIKAIYQIQKLVCLVDVRLLQSNGDVIPTGDEVAVGKSPKLDPSILSF